jgi:hypothetical protein
MIEVSQLKDIYEWLRQSNPIYAETSEFHGCPCPIIVEDETP